MRRTRTLVAAIVMSTAVLEAEKLLRSLTYDGAPLLAE